MTTELLSKTEIEQKHFFEARFIDRHQECYYSHVAGITLGVCKCGEYFFVHEETGFSGEKKLKAEWRAHAKGLKQ